MLQGPSQFYVMFETVPRTFPPLSLNSLKPVIILFQ